MAILQNPRVEVDDNELIGFMAVCKPGQCRLLEEEPGHTDTDNFPFKKNSDPGIERAHDQTLSASVDYRYAARRPKGK